MGVLTASAGSQSVNDQFLAAIEKGNLPLAAKLLSQGATVQAKDSLGRDAVEIALNSDGTKLLRWLFVKGAKRRGITDLMLATYDSDRDQVKKLLASGARANVQDDWGDAVLSYALERNDSRILEMLLEAGADPNIRNKIGRTPLFRAPPGMIQKLVKSGAKIEVRDKEGQTPLYAAAFAEQLEEVQALLQLGADPNAIDRYNFSILGALLQGEKQNPKYMSESKMKTIALLQQHEAKAVYPKNRGRLKEGNGDVSINIANEK